MTADPTHRHDEFHRGQVPTAQLADGSADSGFAPISNGDGSVTWGAVSGGGCGHEHRRERFTAAGGAPETFTLADAPLADVNVFVQGVYADPDDVTLAGSDVSLDTTLADVVVILYERECVPCTPTVTDSGALVFPGDDDSAGWGGNFVTAGLTVAFGDVVTVVIAGIPSTYAVAVYSATQLTIMDVPALDNGTHAFTNDVASDVDWRVIVYDPDDPSTYHGALTGSGTYEVATPCP